MESTPDATKLSSTSKDIAVAVRATVQSPPNSKSDVVRFCLCWDMPKIKFGRQGHVRERFYAQYFDERFAKGEENVIFLLPAYHGLVARKLQIPKFKFWPEEL